MLQSFGSMFACDGKASFEGNVLQPSFPSKRLSFSFVMVAAASYQIKRYQTAEAQKLPPIPDNGSIIMEVIWVFYLNYF